MTYGEIITGENVGILTSEVFGLEVTKSGFHAILSDEVENADNIEEVLHKFKDQVGDEGKRILHALFVSKKNSDEYL